MLLAEGSFAVAGSSWESHSNNMSTLQMLINMTVEVNANANNLAETIV